MTPPGALERSYKRGSERGPSRSGHVTAGSARRMLAPMHDARPDSALMAAWQQGDEAAFDTLYTRHKGPVYRYLLRSVTPAVAAELAQEIWLNLIKARARYVPRAKFTTYLYRLARNRLIDHVRQTNRRPRLVANADDEQFDPVDVRASSQAELADAKDLGDAIRVALTALPDEQREAFLLREEAGMSLAEIADVTGVGRETAKSRLRYATAKLREELGPWLERYRD